MSSKKKDTYPAKQLAIFKFDEELKLEQIRPLQKYKVATRSNVRKADGVYRGCTMGRGPSQDLNLQLGCKRT
jgi:maleate cis-trans isomerase